MPANFSKAIHNAVEEKLTSLANSSMDTENNNIANMIAGSGSY